MMQGGCNHFRISKIRCKPLELQRTFLFYCKSCGKSIVKRIIEIKMSTGKSALKEVTSVIPSEILPWRDNIQNTFDLKEIISKGAVIELPAYESKGNGTQ